MSATDDEDTLWFVVECSEDDSVSLIAESQIITTDIKTVQTNDTVTVFISDKSYVGIVRHISRDYSAMRQKLKDVQKERRRKEASFHVENPRGAALKAAETWASLEPTDKSKSASKPKPTPREMTSHPDDNSSASAAVLQVSPKPTTVDDKSLNSTAEADRRVFEFNN